MRKFKATRKGNLRILEKAPFCVAYVGGEMALIPAHPVVLVRIVLCDSAQKLIQLARDCETKGSWPLDGQELRYLMQGERRICRNKAPCSRRLFELSRSYLRLENLQIDQAQSSAFRLFSGATIRALGSPS